MKTNTTEQMTVAYWQHYVLTASQAEQETLYLQMVQYNAYLQQMEGQDNDLASLGLETGGYHPEAADHGIKFELFGLVRRALALRGLLNNNSQLWEWEEVQIAESRGTDHGATDPNDPAIARLWEAEAAWWSGHEPINTLRYEAEGVLSYGSV